VTGRLAAACITGMALLLSTTASAMPDVNPGSGVLCLVVGPESTEGLDVTSLRDALEIERQKAGVDVRPVVAQRIQECPVPDEGARWLALRLEGGVLLQWADGSTCPLDLAGVEVSDRARVAARRVVGLLADPQLARKARLVEGDLAWRAPARIRIQEPSRVPPVDGYLHLGGRGVWQVGPNRGSGDLEFEAGLLLLQRRLWIGGRVGYEPLRSVPGPRGAVHVQAVPVGLMGRWTFPVGPVGIRVGLGALVVWRQARIEPQGFAGSGSATSVDPAFDGEVEVTHVLWDTMHLSAGLTARMHATWSDFRWFDANAYRGPRFEVGAVVRVAAILRGKR
jgi:hypothetical protein